MSDGPIAAFLAELRARVPWHTRGRRRWLTEIADHLAESADAAEATGMPRIEAERRAIQRLGSADELAGGFIGSAPRRPSWSVVAVGAATLLAAAFAGLAISHVSGTGPPSRSARPTSGSRVEVSLVRRHRSAIPVLGGTAAMRARAREILDGLGHTSIARVAFGRPPKWAAHRFRHTPGPIWITITVGVPRSSLRNDGRTQSRLWAVDVFESAYEATRPPGTARIHGTSELATDGPTTVSLSGQVVFSVPRAPASPSPRAVVADLASAARASGLRLAAVRLVRIGASGLAASARLTVAGRRRFSHRLGLFLQGTGRMQQTLYGLNWTLDDRCGNHVYVAGPGFAWASPRWLCPNPYVIGFETSRATCKKLERTAPAC